MVAPEVDNMLKITNDGRKLALDQRLMSELLPDSDTGKIAACAANDPGRIPVYPAVQTQQPRF